MDGFVLGKDRFAFKVATVVPLKVRDPFLRVKKKMEPVVDIKVGRQAASTLAIFEAEAPQPVRRSSFSGKGRGDAGFPIGGAARST